MPHELLGDPFPAHARTPESQRYFPSSFASSTARVVKSHPFYTAAAMILPERSLAPDRDPHEGLSPSRRGLLAFHDGETVELDELDDLVGENARSEPPPAEVFRDLTNTTTAVWCEGGAKVTPARRTFPSSHFHPMEDATTTADSTLNAGETAIPGDFNTEVLFSPPPAPARGEWGETHNPKDHRSPSEESFFTDLAAAPRKSHLRGLSEPSSISHEAPTAGEVADETSSNAPPSLREGPRVEDFQTFSSAPSNPTVSCEMGGVVCEEFSFSSHAPSRVAVFPNPHSISSGDEEKGANDGGGGGPAAPSACGNRAEAASGPLPWPRSGAFPALALSTQEKAPSWGVAHPFRRSLHLTPEESGGYSQISPATTSQATTTLDLVEELAQLAVRGSPAQKKLLFDEANDNEEAAPARRCLPPTAIPPFSASFWRFTPFSSSDGREKGGIRGKATKEDADDVCFTPFAEEKGGRIFERRSAITIIDARADKGGSRRRRVDESRRPSGMQLLRSRKRCLAEMALAEASNGSGTVLTPHTHRDFPQITQSSSVKGAMGGDAGAGSRGEGLRERTSTTSHAGRAKGLVEWSKRHRQEVMASISRDNIDHPHDRLLHTENHNNSGNHSRLHKFVEGKCDIAGEERWEKLNEDDEASMENITY
ncbi:unnamed protein product [Phytomonas sp. Hart1]|nr:unnamed protein product [Phytomonas sp. Hart1]|eukprot:CCW69869.1 unnamed protein product [Phytomonas sp. isolate Hart1]